MMRENPFGCKNIAPNSSIRDINYLPTEIGLDIGVETAPAGRACSPKIGLLSGVGDVGARRVYLVAY